MDTRPNRKRWFFFDSSDLEIVINSVQDFWRIFERQLGRISSGSKKSKAKTGFDTLDDRRKRIEKDRLNLTLFLENHLGGADVCYRMSRQNILIKLVNFVNNELDRRKHGRTDNSRVQAKGR